MKFCLNYLMTRLIGQHINLKMEEPLANSYSSNSNKPSTTLKLHPVSPYRAKRTVSFKDKDAKQPIHTIHHVESLKKYNATEERNSCLKCNLL